MAKKTPSPAPSVQYHNPDHEKADAGHSVAPTLLDSLSDSEVDKLKAATPKNIVQKYRQKKKDALNEQAQGVKDPKP